MGSTRVARRAVTATNPATFGLIAGIVMRLPRQRLATDGIVLRIAGAAATTPLWRRYRSAGDHTRGFSFTADPLRQTRATRVSLKCSATALEYLRSAG
jgi:hypothetical protein